MQVMMVCTDRKDFFRPPFFSPWHWLTLSLIYEGEGEGEKKVKQDDFLSDQK